MENTRKKRQPKLRRITAYLILAVVLTLALGASVAAYIAAGDRLSLYIGDEFFAVPKKIDPFLSKIAPRLNILFENES